MVSFQTAGTGTPVESDAKVPTEYSLEQNYPNPFNPVTVINFTIPQSAYASLDVYSSLGKHVASLCAGDLEAGNHTVQWDASGQASGVYFYRLTSGHFSATKRMILVR